MHELTDFVWSAFWLVVGCYLLLLSIGVLAVSVVKALDL